MSTTQQEQIPYLNVGNKILIGIITFLAIFSPYVIVYNMNKDYDTTQSQPSAIKSVTEQIGNSNSIENSSTVAIDPDKTMKATITEALFNAGINNVQVAIDNSVATLTGNIPRADLSKIMQIVNGANPKKVINKLILSSDNNSLEGRTSASQPVDYTTNVESALSNAINAFDDGKFSDAFNYYTEAAGYPTDRSTSIKQTAANKFKEKAERIIANNNGVCDDLSRQLLQYANKLYPSNETQQLLIKYGVSSGVNSSNSGKFPQGSERLLSSADLSGLSKYDLKIMRNEIFARHGYIFMTNDMKNYFQNQSWYTPRYSNVTAMLTSTEQKNVALIKRYE